MSRKDYVQLALLVARSLVAAYLHGGEAARTAVYEELYEGMIALLKADNPSFDQTRFAYAVGVAETELLASARVG